MPATAFLGVDRSPPASPCPAVERDAAEAAVAALLAALGVAADGDGGVRLRPCGNTRHMALRPR